MIMQIKLNILSEEKVNYPRVNLWASYFSRSAVQRKNRNEGLIGETNELPSPQASIRAIPTLHRKRMLSFRDILVSLGQVSNNERTCPFIQ
jgi:hypothetical protein